MQSTPWYETPDTVAARLGESNRLQRCTCCEQVLKRRFRMLELDQRTQTYHDFGGVPENESQGWFPFGLACAETKLAEAEKIAEAKAKYEKAQDKMDSERNLRE